MKKLVIIIMAFVAWQTSFSQQKFTVMFYNLENLFDTINDPAKNDEDFLPESTVAWNTRRYMKKLDHLSYAIKSADSANYPAIIGVAEAENKNVLQDLITKTDLKKKKYDVILEEGPDPRGIDVGLIYRKDMFSIIKVKPYRGADSFDGRFILYVKMKSGKDTLHIFVNHWKSRQGGTSETAGMRMESAVKLKAITDSLFAKNKASNIIIMGDFNDEPTDASLSAGLKVFPPEKEAKQATLYDLMFGPLSRDEGTLYYKDWDIFDQIIVSGNLLKNGNKHGLKAASKEAGIVKKRDMLYKNRQGVMVPNRTASGKEYFGGYSDHLPVFMVLEKK